MLMFRKFPEHFLEFRKCFKHSPGTCIADEPRSCGLLEPQMPDIHRLLERMWLAQGGPQNFHLLNDYGVPGKCSTYHNHIERRLLFWERD